MLFYILLTYWIHFPFLLGVDNNPEILDFVYVAMVAQKLEISVNFQQKFY